MLAFTVMSGPIQAQAPDGSPTGSAGSELLEKATEAYRQDDYGTALAGFRTLAEQGYAKAQSDLAVMYDRGKGAPQDFKVAYAWFNIAAAQGVHRAEKARDALAEAMTAKQLAEAQDLSRNYWKRHVVPFR